MKIYLVTGGSGFIGSCFVKYLFESHGTNIRVINLDNLTYAGNNASLSKVSERENYTFIKGNICDINLVDSIFKKNKIDYVVNFAAESHVDRSIQYADEFIRTNILGTFTLLDTAKRYWELENNYVDGVKFIQVSTDEVYGSLGETGYFSENTHLDPRSPYSASKASADLIVKSYHDTHNMPVNITRCSNNYGPYQYPEKLIPLLIKNCLLKKPLPVYGDGLHVRDWLYVKDHCIAIDLVLHGAKNGEIYNVGGNNEKTNIEIVKLIISYLHDNYDYEIDESLITYVTDRKGHDRRYAINSEKIKHDLGWHPQTTFEKGIVKTIQWYIENQEWIGISSS